MFKLEIPEKRVSAWLEICGWEKIKIQDQYPVFKNSLTGLVHSLEAAICLEILCQEDSSDDWLNDLRPPEEGE